ncbi:MAG: Acyl-CoA synthetase (AMP-forming)/AMP-acid ligase, partial [Deltaproteobacteria bacterium]|nr:Acyl-CoA synthetase (AMP-forming)/AMP-acid ligase [Deltaproteobacteria bacterium]
MTTPPKWQRPSLTYPKIPVFELLKETARRLPQKPAVIDPHGGKTLTFADLDRESDILAGVFEQWGVQKGDRISFFLSNGWEYFVGFYGALKAGAIVSPINPTYRDRKVQHQVADSESKILFVENRFLPQVMGILSGLPTVEKIVLTGGKMKGNEKFFSLPDLLEKVCPSASSPAITPEIDLAALPYSSGTAGQSKGVMITHFNLVANIKQSMIAVEAREEDVFLSFLPFNHIYGLTYYLGGAVYLGATQITMARFEAEECLRLIEKHRVTVLFAVPPALLAFLDLPPLPPPIAWGIRQKFGVPVARHYGLSEASPTTHANPSARIKDGSVGIAVSDLEDRIMDWEQGLKEMPTGEPGELAVRGPNVFQGYWKHPEDTKLALRNGWLFTGDIAWRDAEGYIYILDRKKEMIRRGGHQFAPAELEGILMEHPSVRDCAVVGIPDLSFGERPKAFVVLHPGVVVEP